MRIAKKKMWIGFNTELGFNQYSTSGEIQIFRVKYIRRMYTNASLP